MKFTISVLASCALFLASQVTSQEANDLVKYNQVTYRGTHNSFHRARPVEQVQRLAAASAFISEISEADVISLFYGQPDLSFQLNEQEIRHFEFDVFADSAGAKFTQGVNIAPGLVPSFETVSLTDPKLQNPGFKVLHIPDVDYETNCITLVDCLTEIKTFSDANPTHLPITITLQPREKHIIDPATFNLFTLTTPEKYTPALLQSMEDEILSVFDEEDILMPNDVIDANADTRTWPLVNDLRGKVIFTFHHDNAPLREMYLNLKGPSTALMFLMDTAAQRDNNTAFIVQDGGGSSVQALVQDDYVVRSNPDLIPSRPDDTAANRPNEDAANGINLLASDYAVPRTDDMVQFKRNIGGDNSAANIISYEFPIQNMCNELNGGDNCDTSTLEALSDNGSTTTTMTTDTPQSTETTSVGDNDGSSSTRVVSVVAVTLSAFSYFLF